MQWMEGLTSTTTTYANLIKHLSLAPDNDPSLSILASKPGDDDECDGSVVYNEANREDDAGGGSDGGFYHDDDHADNREDPL
jgi:hypothetical protein